MIHNERKHSKFSASGASRWFACPGSVELSEDQPRRDSVWSKEGTRAHEVLEAILREAIDRGLSKTRIVPGHLGHVPHDMIQHAMHAANFILRLHADNPKSDLLVETRISLEVVHPEAFGTFDAAVVDYFGTLHVFDFKYGAGHEVKPGTLLNPNHQMVFYGLGACERYDWNFKRVRLWIIQPRIANYEKPVYVEFPIMELRKWIRVFQVAATRVVNNPDLFVEGQWCHWCNAKSVCPLKKQNSLRKAASAFANQPF